MYAKTIVLGIVLVGILLFIQPAYGAINVTNFTSNTTWTPPAEVTWANIEVWGAGGGGGGGGSSNRQGGGGGAGGQYAVRNITSLPVQEYTVTVGSGGLGPQNAEGEAGTNSWFNSTLTVLAKGGPGGRYYSGSGAGAGGTINTSGGVGTTVYAGGNGASGTATYSGGGGGGAGTTGTGNAASTTTGGGAKTLHGGAGGAGSTANSGAGGGGNTYGGAGAGATKNSQPGNGADGLVIITYFYTVDTTPPSCTWENNTITNGSARINATCNEAANMTVRWGTTTNLGSTDGNTSLSTTPVYNITGLQAGTQYYWNATSCDAAGNCANTSTTYTFTTESAGYQWVNASINTTSPFGVSVNGKVVVHAIIQCLASASGNCPINATLQYNASGTTPSTRIPSIVGDTPVYSDGFTHESYEERTDYDNGYTINVFGDDTQNRWNTRTFLFFSPSKNMTVDTLMFNVTSVGTTPIQVAYNVTVCRLEDGQQSPPIVSNCTLVKWPWTVTWATGLQNITFDTPVNLTAGINYTMQIRNVTNPLLYTGSDNDNADDQMTIAARADFVDFRQHYWTAYEKNGGSQLGGGVTQAQIWLWDVEKNGTERHMTLAKDETRDVYWDIYYNNVSGTSSAVGININITSNDSSVSWNVTNTLIIQNVTGGAPDPCAYTSGDWNIDLANNCVITTTVNIGTNKLRLTGTGTFTISSTGSVLAHSLDYQPTTISGTNVFAILTGGKLSVTT